MKKTLVVLFMLGICTVGMVLAQGKERQQADILMYKLFGAYQTYNSQIFDSLVAADFVPDKKEFLKKTESDFYAGQIMEMHFTIDEVIPQNDTLAVHFKWERKNVSFSGPDPILTSGQAVFVFKGSENAWLLYQVQNDNPF